MTYRVNNMPEKEQDKTICLIWACRSRLEVKLFEQTLIGPPLAHFDTEILDFDTEILDFDTEILDFDTRQPH